MSRASHPKKEIELALKYAEMNGWRISVGGSHAWGKMYCPHNDLECRCGEFCITSIWSTPKNPDNHAKALRRVVDNCSAHETLNEAASAYYWTALMEYCFTLNFQLPDDDYDHDVMLERLGAAGCDDALVGIGLPGRIALEFTRTRRNAMAALVSALTDVKRAIPTARLTEAEPDLVGLSDVAEMIGVSRQNMRKLMISYSGSFPAPVHEGSAAIWHLSEILDWLHAKGGYDIDPRVAEVAQVTRQFNAVREAATLDPDVQRLVGPLAV